MLNDESDVVLQVLEILALSHQVEIAKRTEVCVFDLADCTDDSQFLGQVPSDLNPRAFAARLEAFELLHRVFTLVFNFHCPVLLPLRQIIQNRVILFNKFSSVTLHV